MFGSNYIIYAVIAVVVFTVYMAVVNIFRRDRMRERVRNAAMGRFVVANKENQTPAFAALCAKIVDTVGVDPKQQKELSLLLLQAGITSPHAVNYFLFFKRIIQPILLLLGAVVFIKLVVFSGYAPTSKKLLLVMIALMLLVGGLFGAQLFVSNRKQRRQAILLRSFPEALDLLLVCIESGLGLDAALARVCKELGASHPVITSELERTRLELTMLNDRVVALQGLADRTEIIPFKSLVSALIQTERFGTSLIDTLRVLSEDQRVTRLLNAENRAARIPVLIVIPLIFCTLPALVMVILGPPFVRIIDQGGIFGAAGK